MADNIEIPSNGFSIQDTMEYGAGNAELLNDLFAPETSTTSPEEITPIIKEAEQVTPPVTDKPKGKEITPLPENADDKQKDQAALKDFLGNDDEEEEEETKQTPVSQTTEEEETSQGTQFTALANDLFKLGVFNKEEDEESINITTPEEFLERFNQEKKKGASEIVQNFISQFGEDYQNAFDAIFVKGANPKEYFNTYNQIVNFAEMDLSQEANQIKVVKQALANQGFDPEDIDTEVERIQNYGDLETVATKHHKVLVKKEAEKLQDLEQKAEAELQYKMQVKSQYIKNVQEVLNDKLKAKEFDGIPLNPKLVNELQDFLLVDKWKTPTGETLSDFDRTILDLKKPENHALKVKVGLLLKILEKDPTLSTIQKTGVTKKTDTLFSEVARQTSKDKSFTSNNKTNPTSWFLQ